MCSTGCTSADAPVNHVDIAPTTLGLCGLPIPEHMDGTDYSSLVHGTDPPDPLPDSAYLGIPVPTGHGHSVDRPWRGVVTRDNWKYVCLEGQPWMLFNLNEDPYELVNLAYNPAAHGKRAELHQSLREWRDHTGDTFDLPPAS